MNRRAIIRAGGKGSRLRPYTIVLPKPLMAIGEYTILEVVVRQLIKKGFNHITMAVNHQASLIKSFFGDGSKWSVKIDYYQEDAPLGTMGPLKKINDLPEHFLIMNGDILTDLNFEIFLMNMLRKIHYLLFVQIKEFKRLIMGFWNQQKRVTLHLLKKNQNMSI